MDGSLQPSSSPCSQRLSRLLSQTLDYAELREFVAVLGDRTNETDLRTFLPCGSVGEMATYLAEAAIRRGIVEPLLEQLWKSRSWRRDEIRRVAESFGVILPSTRPAPYVQLQAQGKDVHVPKRTAGSLLAAILIPCAWAIWLASDFPTKEPVAALRETGIQASIACSHPEFHEGSTDQVVSFRFASNRRPDSADVLSFPDHLDVSVAAKHIFVEHILRARDDQVQIFSHDEYVLCSQEWCGRAGVSLERFLRSVRGRQKDVSEEPALLRVYHVDSIAPRVPSGSTSAQPPLLPKFPPVQAAKTEEGEGSPKKEDSHVVPDVLGELPEVVAHDGSLYDEGLPFNAASAAPSYMGASDAHAQGDSTPCPDSSSFCGSAYPEDSLACDSWEVSCAKTSTFPDGFGVGEFTVYIPVLVSRSLPEHVRVNSGDDRSAREGVLVRTVKEIVEPGSQSLVLTRAGELVWRFNDASHGEHCDVRALFGAPEGDGVASGRWHGIALIRRWVDADDALLELWIDGVLADVEISSSRANLDGGRVWLWALDGEIGPVLAWDSALPAADVPFLPSRGDTESHLKRGSAISGDSAPN
jgi:hypothetical protein